MKHIKTFEDYINEAERPAEQVRQGDMDQASAKKLLQAAIQQTEDKFQVSYTIEMGPKKLEFDTFSALAAMVGGEEGGDFGVNVAGDGTLEIFWGSKDEKVGKLNQDKLSAAMQMYTVAFKKAQNMYKKEGGDNY